MHDRPLTSTLLGRVLVAMLVAFLAASLLPATAHADHNAANASPCDDAQTADDFADYDEARDTHKPSIDCAVHRGITSGAGTNSGGEPIYRPGQAVTRAQMAQFIVNTIKAAGYDSALPGGEGRDEFTDISDNFARVAINRLARADIVGGTGGNRYTPNGVVTRQQMASFIVQAARHVVGEDHPVERDSEDRFTDVADSNVHKTNIEAGADAGLFQGTSENMFTPTARVLRDQMATFLVNLLRYTFNPEAAPAPNTAEIAIADSNVDAGGEISGDITGENVSSATVSGCGLTDAALADEDDQAEGIQFKVTIPESQPAGDCTLSFEITFENGSVRSYTRKITVSSANGATVTLEKDQVSPGETINGAITGTNVKSATVSGCSLSNEPAQDRDTAKAGIQFSEVIPTSQPVGNCVLTFRVTFNDNTTQDVTKQLRVVERTGVTTRPELIAAAIVSTNTTGDNPGTIVRYTFDETVTGAPPDRMDFSVYSFDGARTNPATSAQIDSADQRSVLARFAGITTTADAADLTVAGVAAGAVTDDQSASQTNPQGAAPIGTQREETVRTAGITAAPDLQQVSGFRAVDADVTAVDFGFDEIAYVVNRTGFNLVLTDGTVVNCQGPTRDSTTGPGTSQQGGNGTTTITVTCENPGSGTSTVRLSATNVARGYVGASTVSDTRQPTDPVSSPEPNTNALQAAAVASTGTPRPDLLSAELRPNPSGGDDVVVYTFDQTVFPPGSSNPVTGGPEDLYYVYETTAGETSAESVSRNESNTSQILATFEPGTLTDVVGVSVRAGAATAAAGPGQGQTNQADEVGVANSTTRTITPGKTQAPELVSVSVNPSNGSATYTFDEELNTSSAGTGAADPGSFYLWGSKGEQMQCVGVPGGPTFTVGGEGKANQVSCSGYRAGNSQATAAQIGAAVLGSVAAGAVDDREEGASPTRNPEGAVPTTGGTGKPEN